MASNRSGSTVNETLPVNLGIVYWDLSIDDEGHSEYVVRHKVQCNSYDDGPETVIHAPGLPVAGETLWRYGNDRNLNAVCTRYAKVTLFQHKEGDPHLFWLVEQKFSTRPFRNCAEDEIETPWEQPDRISGSFTKYTEASYRDKNDLLIKTPSHEPFKGTDAEWDNNRPNVIVEQNRLVLDLAIFSRLMDKVNAGPMWGLPARTVKLSNVSWEQRQDGRCTPYFMRRFEFDIRYETFDRYLMNEGTKALGKWNHAVNPPVWVAGGDPNDPRDFNRYKDQHGEIDHILLNLDGTPLDDADNPTYTFVQKYHDDVQTIGSTMLVALGLPGDANGLFVQGRG